MKIAKSVLMVVALTQLVSLTAHAFLSGCSDGPGGPAAKWDELVITRTGTLKPDGTQDYSGKLTFAQAAHVKTSPFPPVEDSPAVVWETAVPTVKNATITKVNIISKFNSAATPDGGGDFAYARIEFMVGGVTVCVVTSSLNPAGLTDTQSGLLLLERALNGLKNASKQIKIGEANNVIYPANATYPAYPIPAHYGFASIYQDRVPALERTKTLEKPPGQ